MKIYLAARYSRIDEINEYADQLRKAGYQVDARWLLGNHQIHEGVDKVEGATVSVPMEGQSFALDDVADLQDAEVVISFTEPPRSTSSRGGRHVEFGMALARIHRWTGMDGVRAAEGGEGVTGAMIRGLEFG